MGLQPYTCCPDQQCEQPARDAGKDKAEQEGLSKADRIARARLDIGGAARRRQGNNGAGEGADGEEGDVAEVQHAGKAVLGVQTDREQAIDQGQCREAGCKGCPVHDLEPPRQQAARTHEQHRDQDQESKSVGIVGRDVGRAEFHGQTDQQPADHGAVGTADAAEQHGGKDDQQEAPAHVGNDGNLGYGEQSAAKRADARADEPCMGMDAPRADAGDLCKLGCCR